MNKVKHKWYKHIIFFWFWNKWEKILLLVNSFITLVLLIYQCSTGSANDWKTWIAFLANILNIISVILATKKRISCFIWGILAVIGFGGVAFGNQATGNWLLYWVFYVPAQIVALYLWKKKSINKYEIKPTSINWWQIIIAVIASVGFIVLFVWIEGMNGFQELWYGPNAPKYGLQTHIFDASILILSIVMTIFTWCRFKERWYVSIVIDCCQIGLWASIIHQTGMNNISAWIMIVSSVTMLISATYGAFNWKK